MHFEFRNDHVQEVAAFQARTRVKWLAVVLVRTEGITQIRQSLGDAAALRLREEHGRIIRELLEDYAESLAIEGQGDVHLLAFSRPSDAVMFAIQLLDQIEIWNRNSPQPILDRVGIHAGEILIEAPASGDGIRGLNGLEVDKCERVTRLAEPGRVLLSGPVYEMAKTAMRGQPNSLGRSYRWLRHGPYRFEGLREPIEICEVGLGSSKSAPAPADSAVARRVPSVAALSRSRLAQGVGLVTLVGVVLLLLEAPPFVGMSYDLAYSLRREERPPEAILIEMDPDSYRAEGVDASGRWDRRLHARLIERLTPHRPWAIILDSYFDAEDQDKEADRSLVEAARKSTNVFVVAYTQKTYRHEIGAPVLSVQPPFPALREVVHWGPSTYGVVARRAFEGSETTPSLPSQLKAVLRPNAPPAKNPPEWLLYYGCPGRTFDSLSYSQALHEALDPSRFAGRLVFIGVNYPVHLPAGRSRERSDSENSWETPYSLLPGVEPAPGVEVLATACLNKLRGEGLRRLPVWLEILVLAWSGLLSVGLVAGTRPRAGVVAAISAAGAVAYLGMASVWWTFYWFPWLIVAAAQIPLALVWCTIARLEGRPPALPQNIERDSRTFATPDRLDAPPRGPAAVQGIQPTLRIPPSPSPPAQPVPADTCPDPAPLCPLGGQPRRAPDDTPEIPDHTLVRRIGRGAYGEVWLCRNAVGIYRAVKVVRRATFPTEAPYEREFAGIEKYAPVSLSHPSLLPILHIGRRDNEGYFFYVMELGDDFHSRPEIDPTSYESRNLDKVIRVNGPLPLRDCLQLGEHLAGALEVLHQHKLLHRDIKPANIIFLRGLPKLADIGLVTRLDRSRAGHTYVGTVGFMPPEGPGTVAADIYGLGKVLYEAGLGMQAGNFPQLPEALLQRSDCQAMLDFNEILLRACDGDVARRYSHADELRHDLHQLRNRLYPST